jgi:two-component system, NtrC family, sensor kinase
MFRTPVRTSDLRPPVLSPTFDRYLFVPKRPQDMPSSTTLRRELLFAFAVVFAGALIVAVAGTVLLVPTFETPVRAVVFLTLLLGADLYVFFLFGRWLLRTRVLNPLDRMVGEASAIARGDYGHRIPRAGSRELDRLSESVNRMAERLINHQLELAQNVESLERTNLELTDARDELIRAEKMVSLGQMAAGVAHEIGNPLSAVMGNTDLLRRRLRGEDLELAEATLEQVRRIDRIVKGLLDYARGREGKRRPINVNEVVSTTLALMRSQPRFQGIEVTAELGPALPAVEADPYQLEQVLVNLLLNAADAMEDAPERCIRLSTSYSVFQSPVVVPTRRKDDPPGIDYSHRRRFHRPQQIPRVQPFVTGDRVVEIRVEDTGTGIPAEHIARIFEPFMTTKEPGKGTGLGLAIAARVIDGMDGTIRAHNTDRGALFTILLPASDEPAEAVA